MTDCPTAPGTLRPVYRRGRLKLFLVDVRCPYCGRRHVHGGGADGRSGGYRAPHCGARRGQYLIDIINPEAAC